MNHNKSSSYDKLITIVLILVDLNNMIIYNNFIGFYYINAKLISIWNNIFKCQYAANKLLE